ncbi:non-hydrolyzing UDP-N-acetylglucosamine 2-epimerase [Campylobacter novaezeelandiae]|uniref:non-hydrolyzing UDP-N-acetylglucosamine 2-epimerase n=1 Tax=Campylobacter novaezeelandiae TaxID=2267891 RepID=UPI002D7EA8B4|nr:UDP-N-acetylglucosamine 2-epimerase (non-hydrolyzing) [Campylobacter novaezeelandiae]
MLFVFGTRPEVIKLAPVILKFKKNPAYKIILCNTEQQKDLSNQALNFFGIKADICLDIMSFNQNLSDLGALLLLKLKEVFTNNKIDATIIQGDTMSAFYGALSAFYHKVFIFHIEAGLRSYDNFEPFPEEALRNMISKIATLHFAPTSLNVKFLKKELKKSCHKNIFQTGNTSIDSLMYFYKKQERLKEIKINTYKITSKDKIVLITIHRRENFDKKRLEGILKAIVELSKYFCDFKFILPMHPNPNVKNEIKSNLNFCKNIILSEALSYENIIFLMRYSALILTDSGGIQEEAPSFGTPLLILRYKTERMEGVRQGFAKLVGTNKNKIIKEASSILAFPKKINKANPYGDASASDKIIHIIEGFFNG